MKTKIENLIKSYEAEINYCRGYINKSEVNKDVYGERICTLKMVIADLKKLIESEEL